MGNEFQYFLWNGTNFVLVLRSRTVLASSGWYARRFGDEALLFGFSYLAGSRTSLIPLGSNLSVFARFNAGNSFLVGSVCLGSSLSLREFLRSDSALSAAGLTCFGSSVSSFGRLAVANSLSTCSFGRSGKLCFIFRSGTRSTGTRKCS
jgi:hypothetical protein